MGLLLVKTSDNQIFILENVTDSCTSSADRSPNALSNRLIRLPRIVDSDLSIFTNCRAKRSARAPRKAEDLICVTLKALVLLQSVQVPNLDGHVVAGGQQNILGQRMKSYEVNLLQMSIQLPCRGVCGLFQAALRNLPDFQCAVIARNDELTVVEGIPLEVHDIGSVNKRWDDAIGKSSGS